MSFEDALKNRRRASEEEFFTRRDADRIARLRTRADEIERRRKLGEVTGVRDPAVLDAVAQLGFTADSLPLLFLTPAVHMAWLEGGVTRRERERMLERAARGGISPGTPAYARLEEWLAERPPEAFLQAARRVLGALLDALEREEADRLRQDTVGACEDIARCSGGILGLARISRDEHRLLREIEATLAQGAPAPGRGD